MKNIFQDIGLRKPRKSTFNLSHQRKSSYNPGYLYPVLCHDTMPGDVFNISTSAMVRMMPMRAPIFHMVDCCSYTFRVPMRLCMLQGKWETFITGGENGDGKDAQGNTIQIPYAIFVASGGGGIGYSNLGQNYLGDHLGIGMKNPDGSGMGLGENPINMMPFIAYWRIWCEYFRDQNLHPDYVSLYPGIFQATGDITPAIIAAAADPDNPFDFWSVPKVCWSKDMYTSALPFAQRGQPVETPLSGNATVTYKNPAETIKTASANAGHLVAGTGASAPVVFEEDITGDTEPIGIDNIDSVELTTGGFTINALRLAARLQEWLERMARGGARYVEQTLSMWGVISSDARLQRAEYLGGGKMNVNISEVLQTSENGTTPLGEMAGHGVSVGNLTNVHAFFEEHCYIISVFFMRPQTAYQQGIPRLFTNRFDKLNWPWWQFANLGEQEVLGKEIYFDGNINGDDATFGYQQRLAEYKYIPSTVHGEFKSSLDFYHWGRIFPTRPELTPEFVQCDPDPRIFNVIQDTDSLYAIINHKITAIRPLPYYGEPTL